MRIDTDFDHRSDAGGKDPDSASPTLRKHHQLLWSKSLPSGTLFSLSQEAGSYLVHRSELGEFTLSSDTIINSLRARKGNSELINQIPEEHLDSFQRLGATIGARLIFPANRIEGKPTLNVARGFSARIGDRFDLTLECIRRHYLRETSPLEAPIARYKSFFELFESFEGYVDFFLLNDLLAGSRVKFFLPFTGEFGTRPLPATKPEYLEYMRNSMEFVERRNQRIDRLENQEVRVT
jgi:hypothetical protein